MNHPRTWLSAIIVSVCLALLAGCSTERKPISVANIKPAADRQQAPDFELKDANGATVSLSDYRGKVVILNFWATWCGPCKMEIPWFVEFEQKHKDRGFAVLGISMDEGGWETVKPFLERVRVNYRILLGTDSVAMLYGGIESIPTSFVIDGSGKIANVHIGLVSKEDYESDIEALLQELAGSRGSGPAPGVPAVILGGE